MAALSSPGFDPVCEAACAGKSVIPAEDGQGAGTIVKIGDMDAYVVGSGERCIINIYDIFGFSPVNSRYNCDLLASAGFMVVMPDLFRGSGRRSEGFVRPQNEDVDKEILDVVVPFVKSRGAKDIGVNGFCFGGGAAMRLASSGVFSACSGIHASGMDSPNGEGVVAKALCPIMLLQAGGDPDLRPVYETIQKMQSIKGVSVLRTYWDQRHGWCGATGDRAGDIRVKAAVESAIGSVIKFMTRTLVPPPQYILHIYDHCPFCVKAELAMGLLGFKYDRKVWGYGEGAKAVGDFAGSSVRGPAGLMNAGETTGVKALPILETTAKRSEAADWKSASPYLRESSDIIAHINQFSGMKLAPRTDAGMEWQKGVGALGQLTTVYKFRAAIPLAGDYQHAEDLAYGHQKYLTTGKGKYALEETKGDGASAKLLVLTENEASLLAEATASLAAFETDVLPRLTGAGLDDVHILPTLRNATCIPGLTWPEGTKKYVVETCAKASVATYFTDAQGAAISDRSPGPAAKKMRTSAV